MKERTYDERRRHGGWNPTNLSENIEINNSHFSGVIKGMIEDEDN